MIYSFKEYNCPRREYDGTGYPVVPTDADIMVYNYDDPEHINAVTSINYNGTNYGFTYDANGNMKTGYDFTNPAGVATRTIEWNADNMPVTVTRGSATTYLTYDGDGVRAKKAAGGITTYYVSSDYEIKNGTPVKYIFAGNLRVAEIEGSASTIYHKDHLGSSTAMTNSAGTKIEATEYLPFGGMREHTGTNTTDYLYTDQEIDISSNLYNYDARLYDPVIGRFISPDVYVQEPYNPQSLSRYSYCMNNPLIYVDPSGHFWLLDWIKLLFGGSEAKAAEIKVEVKVENKQDISEVSWGETKGLYPTKNMQPSKKELYNSSEWDKEKQKELQKARAGVDLVKKEKRNEVVREGQPNPNNPIDSILSKHHLRSNLPEADKEIKDDLTVTHFLLSSDPKAKHEGIVSKYWDQKIVKSYGPFYNTGGGDAPKGPIYILFYSVTEKK